MFIKQIGLDLGTTNTLVYVPKQGVVVNEPSIIATYKDSREVLAVGNQAKDMVGRTPADIIAKRPLKDGVIADYRAAEAMLEYFVNKARGRLQIFRPELIVAVPAGISSTEQRVVIEAGKKAGAKEVFLLKEPLAAAIGSGLSIDSALGHMIVDIGGGTTENAVISLGGIVAAVSSKVGGNRFDQAIAKFIRDKYKLAIGEQAAEEIKIKAGSATFNKKDAQEISIEGSHLTEGLPKSIQISSNELTEAMTSSLNKVISSIKKVLQDTPPQLSADVIRQGIVLSGGGGKLKNLDKKIENTLKIKCQLTDEPLLDVARGVGKVLENLDQHKRALLSSKR